MTYITGTVTNANPGPTLWALMDTALLGAGFTLVDTVVISTRTHKIYLSAAAGNAISKDWYLDVAYTTTGAGQLFLGVMEFFDAATDLAYRAAFNGTGGIEATYYSRYGATGQTLELAAWGYYHTGGAGSVSNGTLDLVTSAVGYWISITRNRVIVLLSTNPAWALYAGSYAPSVGHTAAAGADLYPLIAAKLYGGGPVSMTASGITRIPKHTSAGSMAWQIAAGYAPGTASIRPPGLPADHVTAYARAAVPMTINTSGSAGNIAGAFPWAYLGTFRDVATIAAEATVVRGDTVSDGTDTWVLASSSSANSVLFKAV